MLQGAQGGFSLIEVLAAVAILALVALPLLGMFTAAMQAGHAAQLQSIAILHAQQLMEEAVVGTTNPLSGTIPFGSISNFFSYSRSIDVDSTGLRRITIIVSWTEARGPRSYRVVTLVD